MEGSVSTEIHPRIAALSIPEEIYWTLFHPKDKAGHWGGSSTIKRHPTIAAFSLGIFSLQRLSETGCSTLGLTKDWEGSTQMPSLIAVLCKPEEVGRAVGFVNDWKGYLGNLAPQKCPSQ